MSDYGTLQQDVDRAIVRFERTIGAAIDVVWDLIATDTGLEKWLAPARVDLRIGGDMDIDFGEDGLAGGAITRVEAPTLLEYHWQFPGEPDSMILFQLEETDEGTRLVLEHRLLPLDQCIGYGAGWHAHLDQLEAMATEADAIDWDARFGELLPEYRLAATA